MMLYTIVEGFTVFILVFKVLVFILGFLNPFNSIHLNAAISSLLFVFAAFQFQLAFWHFLFSGQNYFGYGP